MDPAAHPVAMVLAAQGRGDDGVDEVPAFLGEDLPKAVLLGVELVIERRFRHARAGDDVIDRRLVIAAGREHRQRGLRKALAALQPPGLAWVVSAYRRRRRPRRHQSRASALEMTSRWISLVPSNRV